MLESEQICWIVLILQGYKPFVARAISGLDAAHLFIVTQRIYIASVARERLYLLEELTSPADVLIRPLGVIATLMPPPTIPTTMPRAITIVNAPSATAKLRPTRRPSFTPSSLPAPMARKPGIAGKEQGLNVDAIPAISATKGRLMEFKSPGRSNWFQK